MVYDINLLKNSFERLPLGVVIFDREGKIIYFNQEIQDLAGDEGPDEEIGQHYGRLWAYQKNGLVFKIRRAFNGEFVSFESKYKSRSGKSRRYFQILPLRDNLGVQFVVMFVQDISAQAHLAEINTRLNVPNMDVDKIFSIKDKRNLFLNKLLSALNQTVLFVCDDKGQYKYIWADEVGLAKAGVKKGEFMSDRLDQAPFFQQDIKTISDFSAGETFRHVVELNLPKGKFAYDVSIAPMTAITKKQVYYFGVIRDITAKYQIEKQLKQQIETIARINAALVKRELQMIELKKENQKLKQ
jgi:PAS domain S-box-containing protein